MFFQCGYWRTERRIYSHKQQKKKSSRIFHVISSIFDFFENVIFASKTRQICEGYDILSYYVESEIVMIIIMFKILFKNGSLKMTEMSQYYMC